jgi:hypothetical protein
MDRKLVGVEITAVLRGDDGSVLRLQVLNRDGSESKPVDIRISVDKSFDREVPEVDDDPASTDSFLTVVTVMVREPADIK